MTKLTVLKLAQKCIKNGELVVKDKDLFTQIADVLITLGVQFTTLSTSKFDVIKIVEPEYDDEKIADTNYYED